MLPVPFGSIFNNIGNLEHSFQNVTVTVCSNKHPIFGMANGCIRIHPIHNDDPGLMGPYWSLSMHDNDYGSITQLASSFDDKFIFSVGGDGNFFAFAVIEDKRTEQDTALSKVEVPLAKVGCFVATQLS